MALLCVSYKFFQVVTCPLCATTDAGRVVDALLAQFIDGVDVPVLMQGRRFSCSSWTRLTCPLLCTAKCAVFPACRRHLCRGADADSHGLPLRFSSCSTLTR